MKNFMLKRLILLAALFTLLGVGNVWAQLTELTEGGVYHFTNVRYPEKAMGINASGDVRGINVNKSDYNQLWVVAAKDNSGNFRLQNLGHGGYLQAKGQDGWWTLVDENTTENTYLVLGEDEGSNVFRGVNFNGGYGYANLSAWYGDVILGWNYTDDHGSEWTIELQELDETALNNALDNRVNTNSAVRTAVETALANLFTDAACTTKKKSLTSAQLDTDVDYLALTPTLQKMAKKVYSTANDAWTENNFDNTKSAWDNDYAKKYRVQWYEPYTEPECAASALRINAHTNLNNPTGIFANSGEVLFVMVEGEILDGAYLYLAKYTGHNKLGGYKDGVQLQSGLNVIPVTEDGSNYCINYVVKTFDTSKGTGKKAIIEGRELSNYPDLQIHIEGGYINGYWNKMGDNADHNGDFNYPADDDADWNYIKERATQTDVTVLGEYVTLQFPLTDAGTGDDKGMATFFNSYKDKTTSLEASIEEWDNVMIWERLLMGVVGEDIIEAEDKKSPYSDQPKVTAYTGNDADDFGCDYSEYYRVHGLSFGTEGGYMYGSWDHCGYNFNTMESIMLSIVDEAGPHWGPAHEIGHQHQGPLNMRGLTEVTNNLFSNVVLWYYGKSTARYNGTDGALSNVLQQFNAEGTDFFSNNIWGQTIMYYKLFLYYHVLGHNPKFYPRLFEMLRQDPMTIEYNQDGGECLMHFYKKCCAAAGEDLTEFFRAHGFFEVMEERFVGDYSNAVYTMTQAQIDQAIAEVKANSYPANLAVLFITDATGEGNIKSNRGDDVYLTHFDTNNSGNLISGELGSYATFNTVTAPNYNYSISGNTVTMEGSGGVGFAILNEKGELIGFSDKKTFEISQETMEAISNGEATIAVMPASGEPVPAVSTMSESEIERALLGELIGQAEELVTLIDDEGKKVGFYKSSYTTELENALTSAQGVYSAFEASAYTPAFNALKTVMDDLKSKEYAKIMMKPGTYTVRNFAYNTRYMNVNNSNEVSTTTNAELTNNEKWVFEQGDGHNVYYIKNLGTWKYIDALEQSKVVSATTTDILEAKGWLVEDLGNGVFGLTCQDENNQAMHSAANDSYKIVGWNTGAAASRWYLTALETETLSEEQLALEELIALTEDVLGRVANIEITEEPFTLDETSYYCNAPHKSGGDKLSSYSVLYDNDYTTYLHTDYSGDDSEDERDHYLRVDLGENNSASFFTFNYASRHSSNQNPTEIVIEGCNEENGDYELITILTRNADKLISGPNAEYNSTMLGQENKSYRYLRFTVTGTIQGSTAGPEDNKHVFFVFSEFGVSRASCTVTALAKYSTLTDEVVTNAYNELRAAKYVYATATEAQDYTTAKNALQSYYNTLVTAFETCDATVLTNKKAELQTLIDQANTLIDQCGVVSYTPGTFDGAAPLQTTNENNGFYLSTNAEEPKEGDIANLVDESTSTFFHSAWSVDINAEHYLLVDVGEGNELKNFTFSYQSNKIPIPATIKVYGSNDKSDYTLLGSFSKTDETNPIPTTINTRWTSSHIVTDIAYQYLRFNVSESTGSASISPTPKGEYCFVMSDFDITAYGEEARYEVSVNSAAGKVTEELLLDTYKETQEAVSTKKFATTEALVDRAIAQLEAQIEALSTAKNTIGYVTDLANLSNAGIYGISTSRGPIAYISGDALSTPKKGSAADIPANATENVGEQFAILRTENTPEGKYYLYNIAKQRFVNIDAAFSETPVAITSFSKTSSDAYPWFVWLGSEKRININQGNGLIMCTASYASEDAGNQFRFEIVAEDATKTADAVAAIEAYEALLAAKTTATEFLNSTPETAGYPVEAERTTLQETIDAATDIASIDAAVLDFKRTSNINMPEDGKAYKIKAWWKNEERYMTFVETKDANIFAGSDSAYVPVADNSKAVTFVCRKLGDDTYAFVSDNGYYLGWQADGKKNNTSQNFAVNGYDNTLKIQKGAVNNNGTILSPADLFGTLNILGKNADEGGKYYHFMFNKTSKNYHSGNFGDMYYFDDKHTVYYTFEEVPNYTNSVKMNTLQESDMQLLNGLTPGISLSTFSAPYATVTPEGVTAYYAESITEGTSTVALLKKVRTAIPAGEGVVLLSEEEHLEPIKMLPATTEEVPAEFNNRLTGTGAQPKQMSMDGAVDYILGRGSKGAGFYKAKSGSTLAAGKAYFHFENPSQVRNFVLRFGGDTTGLEDVTLAPVVDNDAIYDLSGRRVNEVTKGGFYIKNGKKFIVK